MLPFLVRRAAYPAHELLLGRRTLGYLRELESSQWLSPDDVQALQWAKLRALLRHARANTAFYAARFRQARLDPDAEVAPDALSRLPLLDKSEIRRSIGDMLWHEAPGGLFQHNTGGSTGEPLAFYFDRRRQAYDQAARMRSHRWFEVDVGDRELYLWGSPVEFSRTDRVKRFRDGLFNHRLLSAFDMSPERMDTYLDEWDRFRPACLFGYPSSIVVLVDHARFRRRKVQTRCLRAVFVTGEPCFLHERKRIAAYFGVPVADGYGSREAGFVAHECPKGMMHITAENVIVEIVNEDGRPVPVGETGEIVVTHLDAYAMPFIRYRTGDIGSLRPGRCECGRGLPMMDVVQGRTTDFLYLPDGTIKHALAVIYPLRGMAAARQFRVTQHEDYSVTVEVVRDGKKGELIESRIEERIRPVFGDQIDVRIELVERIAIADSGKHRYVVSHARPADRRAPREASVGV